MTTLAFELISTEPLDTLLDYARIPSRFTATTVLDPMPDGARHRLVPRPLPSPFHKDYDKLEHPSDWPLQFDTTRWAMLGARLGAQHAAGAILARDTPGVDMLEGRSDLLVLWDIRVAPFAQGRGIGAALFRAAERWGLAQGCIEMKVETQNVNVAACAFYAAMGCTLHEVTPGAYPELPQEARCIWRKPLAPGQAATPYS